MMAVGAALCYAGAVGPSYLDGPKGLGSIGVCVFCFGAIIALLAVLRWVVLQMNWSDRIWGYTAAQAHDALRRMND